MLPSILKLNLLLLVTFHLCLLIPAVEYNRFPEQQITMTNEIEIIEELKVTSQNLSVKLSNKKTKENVQKRNSQEDKSEILPWNKTLDDKSKEILLMNWTLEDKSKEILPQDMMQENKSKKISLMDGMLEDKSEEILPTEILFEGTSEEILPAALPYLTPALIEKARNELGETEELKQRTLGELRKLVEAEKNLVSPTDDVFLLAFLRNKQYDVTKAFKLLQRYWYLKIEYPYIFESVDPDDVISAYSHNIFGFLPYRDRQGCTILFDRIGLWDPEKVSPKLYILAIGSIMLHSLDYEATQIAGFRIILDFRGVGWAQIKYFTPSILMFVVKATQLYFPATYRGVHVLSDDTKITFLWAILYPFFTKEMKELIIFHGEDLKAIQQYIHPSVLPKEFGGLAQSYNFAIWSKKISENKDKTMSYIHNGYILE